MKLKTVTVEIDGKQVQVAVLDAAGLPVYVHDNGQEIGFDAAQATTKITQLNGEAKTHREAKEAAETALKGFTDAGLTDPAAAKKALETVANIDAGQLVAAGKVEEIKAEARKAAETQIADAMKAAQVTIDTLTAENGTLKGSYEGEIKRNAFATSKVIAEKFAIPADLVDSRFGSQFKVEDGKLVGYDAAGNKIYSKANPGELATFDESLETIVGSYPHRESILKSGMGGGGGAQQPGAGGGKTMTRSDFAKLGAAEQAKAAGEMQIVDG